MEHLCLTERLVRINVALIPVRYATYTSTMWRCICIYFAKMIHFYCNFIRRISARSFCVHCFLSEITLTFANDFKSLVFSISFFLSFSLFLSLFLLQQTLSSLQHLLADITKNSPLNEMRACAFTVNGTKDWFFSSSSSPSTLQCETIRKELQQ